MVDRMILFLVGAALAILTVPVQGDPLRAVRPDPLRSVKATVPVKVGCGCGCKECGVCECPAKGPCSSACACVAATAERGYWWRPDFSDGGYWLDYNGRRIGYMVPGPFFYSYETHTWTAAPCTWPEVVPCTKNIHRNEDTSHRLAMPCRS